MGPHPPAIPRPAAARGRGPSRHGVERGPPDARGHPPAHGDADGAIAAYREILRREPDQALGHLGLAAAIRERDGRGGAVVQAALSAAHVRSGWGLFQSGRLDEARSEFHEAIRLAPEEAMAHLGLAQAEELLGNHAGALAALDAAVRLDPARSESWNNRAWFLATCAEPAFRDGRRAVQDARRACELSGWKEAGILDTLASAYAEAGDFAEAIRWQARAVERSDIPELRERLDLFRKSRAFHKVGPISTLRPTDETRR